MESREIDLIDSGLPPLRDVNSCVIELDAYSDLSYFICDSQPCAIAIYNSYVLDGMQRWTMPASLEFIETTHKRPRTADEAAALHAAFMNEGPDPLLPKYKVVSGFNFPEVKDCGGGQDGHPVVLRLQVFSRSDEIAAVFIKFMRWAVPLTAGCEIYLSPWVNYTVPADKVGLTGGGGYYCAAHAHKRVLGYEAADEPLVDKRDRLFAGKKLIEVLKVERWACVSAPDSIRKWYDSMLPVYSSTWSAPSPIDAIIAEIDEKLEEYDYD